MLLRTVDATTPSTRDRALHKWYAIEGRMEKYHCESFIERSGSVDCDEGSQVGIELASHATCQLVRVISSESLFVRYKGDSTNALPKYHQVPLSAHLSVI